VFRAISWPPMCPEAARSPPLDLEKIAPNLDRPAYPSRSIRPGRLEVERSR